MILFFLTALPKAQHREILSTHTLETQALSKTAMCQYISSPTVMGALFAEQSLFLYPSLLP